MRTIEVRRYSHIKKGIDRGKGSHLSAEGVRLARKIGETIGHCDLVLTSHIPRTIETALAMGYAVDDQIAGLGEVPDPMLKEISHHERWTGEETFTVLARIVAQGGATAQVGLQLREIWRAALEAIPSNGKALIITHGHLLEVGLITCLPYANVAHWGGPFQYGEGIRLEYEKGRFRNVEFLRLHEQPL